MKRKDSKIGRNKLLLTFSWYKWAGQPQVNALDCEVSDERNCSSSLPCSGMSYGWAGQVPLVYPSVSGWADFSEPFNLVLVPCGTVGLCKANRQSPGGREWFVQRKEKIG